jgi:hypothetical protein
VAQVALLAVPQRFLWCHLGATCATLGRNRDASLAITSFDSNMQSPVEAQCYSTRTRPSV